jgi:hypothetical protein
VFTRSSDEGAVVNEPVVITYVEYMIFSFFVPEMTVRESPDRDPRRAAWKAPPFTFGFQFFEQASSTASFGGEQVVMKSERCNVSGVYYLDAEFLDAEQVAALPGNHDNVLSSMYRDGCDRVVHFKAGGWFRPVNDGDTVISSTV